MAMDDIASGFGLPSFISIFLPGLTVTTFILFIFNPYSFLDLSNVDKLLILIVSGFFVGMIIASLDIYIYQFFEGIKFWPPQLWWWRYRSVLNDRKAIINELDVAIKARDIATSAEDIKILNLKIMDLSRKFREYPYNLQSVEATRLGNILADYETYSYDQYGMNFNVFWSRIWTILPKEVRDDLELRSARADFLIYLSFCFILLALCVIVKCFISYNIISEAIRRTLSIAGFWNNIVYLMIMSLSASLFIFISYLFYNISIPVHKNYGRYVKATIDVYRIELANKTGLNISAIPNDNEKKTWDDYGIFLEDYERP